MDKCICTKEDKLSAIEEDIRDLKHSLYSKDGIERTVTNTAKDVSYMAKSFDSLRTTFYWLIGLFAGILVTLIKIAFL